MKLLITGATGLVGKELVKKALEQGMIIHYLTTSKSKTIIGARGFYWNPSSQEIDSTRSIFNENFKLRKRIILDSVDYDIFFK